MVIPYSVDTIAGGLTSARVIGTLFAIDPAMGSLVGWLLLGETISAVALVGIILVACSGALLVWLSEAPKEAPEETPNQSAHTSPA